MAIASQNITEQYALYEGDCVEVMQSMPDGKVHLSIYSPPFGGLYHYSSSEKDLSNCADYDQFFNHYDFVVKELHRITMPGRMTAVHCADVPSGNSGCDHMIDFPGPPGGSESIVQGAVEFIEPGVNRLMLRIRLVDEVPHPATGALHFADGHFSTAGGPKNCRPQGTGLIARSDF